MKLQSAALLSLVVMVFAHQSAHSADLAWLVRGSTDALLSRNAADLAVSAGINRAEAFEVLRSLREGLRVAGTDRLDELGIRSLGTRQEVIAANDRMAQVLSSRSLTASQGMIHRLLPVGCTSAMDLFPKGAVYSFKGDSTFGVVFNQLGTDTNRILGQVVSTIRRQNPNLAPTFSESFRKLSLQDQQSLGAIYYLGFSRGPEPGKRRFARALIEKFDPSQAKNIEELARFRFKDNLFDGSLREADFTKFAQAIESSPDLNAALRKLASDHPSKVGALEFINRFCR
jgi:hypothetical protein